MLVALISDTHFGARNASPLFNEYFLRFFEQSFFPILIDRKITHVIHLGDWSDNRRVGNYLILHHVRESILERFRQLGITLWLIVGNHDIYHNNTTAINSVKELLSLYPNIQISEQPEEVRIGKLDILFVPWLNSENMEAGLKSIKHSKAPVLMGHLAINGFEMHRGSLCEDGLQRDLFGHFKKVFSGHFHTRSTDGHVQYLGSPFELAASDVGEPKGFHIFDTETLEVEFIQNPFRMHFRLIYDDRDETTHAALLSSDVEQYRERYLKIIVTHKTTPHLFERWLDRIHSVNPAGVSVFENLGLEEGAAAAEDDLDSEAPIVLDDTLTILNTYVDGLADLDVSRDRLKEIFHELYAEAVNTTDKD